MSTYPATATLPQSGSVVSRWLLDEASGTRSDLEAAGNDLTDNNTVGAGAGLSVNNASYDNSADFELSNSEYLSIADNASLSFTGDVTVNAWVNLETTIGTTDQTIAAKYNGTGNNRSYIFAFDDVSGDRMTTDISSDGIGATGKDSSTTVTINTGTWYMCTWVYDASAGAVEYYVDGVQIGTEVTGLPTSIYDGTAAFTVGAWIDNTTPRNFFDGLMQDLIIWNSELSVTDVSDLYDDYTAAPPSNPVYAVTSSLPQSNSIVSRWPLAETSGTFEDIVGSNDLTRSAMLTGTGFAIGDTDFDVSADFEEGSESHAYIADGSQTGLDLSGDFTFSVWYNPESQPDTTPDSIEEAEILSKYDTASDARSYNFYYENQSGYQLSVETCSDGTGGDVKTGSVAKTLTLGTWVHLVTVYDISEGEVTFYVDGVKEGTTQTGMTTSPDTLHNGTARFVVGAMYDSGTVRKELDGQLNDLIIWNTTLNANEISLLKTKYASFKTKGSVVY
jgi:hypothetical protein